ncbi:MAG: tRNA uridine-5-carboxymethylaminomethyl(34) synthesis GTPase MnmE [Bacilli bacterium]|nr:tRNA uridine-5-carboxymethylaminomethyl(34) synthesis GTPase MnmE [Bacilli bacterium]
MLNDTIVVLSTPPMQSAIALIRMSGKESFKILDKIFSNHKDKDLLFGRIVDENEIVDEVVVLKYKGPFSYTGEDVVEISCHGNLIIVNRIIELCIKYGARMAEKGEFTKKAFYNGKLDLVQAEAVHDIITSRSKESITMSLNGLNGQLSNEIKNLKEKVVNIMANIEVNIDYPEYDDVVELTNELIKPQVVALLNNVEHILNNAKIGKIIKDGVKVAIIGRPNVGKSSLLNALIKEDKAIVTNIEGTTRDIVEGSINIKGINFDFLDTAGIREAKDLVEQIGIEKSRKIVETADITILVLDGSQVLTNEDQELLKLVENKPHIIAINKKDLNDKFEIDGINISALNKDISLLEEKLVEYVGVDIQEYKNEALLANARQIGLMNNVKQSLIETLHSCEQYLPTDLIEIDLKKALDAILDILGETSKVNLDQEIFSKFCLGK